MGIELSVDSECIIEVSSREKWRIQNDAEIHSGDDFMTDCSPKHA